MATHRPLNELLGSAPRQPQPPSQNTPSPTTPAATTPARQTPAQQPDPAVRAPEPGTTERVTLYLHPDDYRALGVAKLDDKVDHNTRLRAMIALWRDDPVLRARIDDLAGRTRGRS